MALDTGKIDLQLLDGGQEGHAATVAPDLNYGQDLGDALRAVRQFRRLTLQDIADRTRVRPVYLQALEEMRIAELPARPFTLGYVRAYAQALGLDPDQAAARFKLALPELDEELGDPIGVRRERDPRVMVIALCGVAILLAIAGWSVSQRLMSQPAENETVVPEAPPVQAPANQAIVLGAPTAPPTEATAPAPYVTPGLGVDPEAAATPAAPAAPPANLGAPFRAKGQVYGTRGSSVILQATRGAQTLVVRRGDGSTAFAQVMNVGDAYGAPTEAGWSAEVSDPTAFEVYGNGALRGAMPAANVPFSRLTPPAPPVPKPAAAPAPNPAPVARASTTTAAPAAARPTPTQAAAPPRQTPVTTPPAPAAAATQTPVTTQ